MEAVFEKVQALETRTADRVKLSEQELLVLQKEVGDFSEVVGKAKQAIEESLVAIEKDILPKLQQTLTEFREGMAKLEDPEEQRRAELDAWCQGHLHNETHPLSESELVRKICTILNRSNASKSLDIIVQLSESWNDDSITKVASAYYSEEFRALQGEALENAQITMVKCLTDMLVSKELPLLSELATFVTLEDPDLLCYFA